MSVQTQKTVAGVQLRRTIATQPRWVARIGARTYVFDAVVGWYNPRNVTSWRVHAADFACHPIPPENPHAFYAEKTRLTDAVLAAVEDELTLRDWQAIRTTR